MGGGIPTFFKTWREKSVQSFKPDPYIATVLNCAMWVLYGLPLVHPDSLLVVTINGTGFFIEMFYITIFFVYSDWSKRLKILVALLVEVVFMGVVVLITLLGLHGTKSRSLFVGILCIVFNITMYMSPLTVMVPNSLGSLSALVQLVLYATYYRTTKWDDDSTTQTEIELQSSSSAPQA
ncbi:hypothetical protein DH2020_042872 [Rehmannia glutinosa]|uniref:Uncharacterized protein n=1 Tax=Rehmannia glutinosa TaxID=99300 RepID=A0ABR0UL76_REHGL